MEELKAASDFAAQKQVEFIKKRLAELKISENVLDGKQITKDWFTDREDYSEWRLWKGTPKETFLMAEVLRVEFEEERQTFVLVQNLSEEPILYIKPSFGK